MNILTSIEDLRKARLKLRGSIGFIPTMGYLHEGHTSLIQLAKKENSHVIVSIFVNPKQFENTKDALLYPRDIHQDLEILKKNHTDIVFLPSVEEIYPLNFQTYVQVKRLSNRLEGEKRPGHFNAVATIVTKLFHITQPNRAYFGQKDAVQVCVIQTMTKDLNMPVEIIIGETIRESDGLAKSSRNIFLSPHQRTEAIVIFQALLQARKLYESGVTNSSKIKLEMKRIIRKSSGIIEYISISDPTTLLEIKKIQKRALISLAVMFGTTRLIDNIFIG